MEKPRYTIADIRKSFSPEKARDELYGDWASALIYRPISFWITPALLKLSIGATPVSIFMLALALAMPLLGAVWGPSAHAVIGIMAFVCMVLDCADGNIARVTATSSETGGYIDFLVDIVYRMTVYGTLGYLADAELSAPAMLTGYIFPTAALAAAIAFGARLCRFREGRLTFYKPDSGATKTGKNGWIANVLFPALSGSDRMLPVLVVATSFSGGLGWVVLWMLSLSIVDFVYTQVVILERLGKTR